MPSINRVNLAGNLTKDPETAFTNDGTAVAKFGLAVSKPGKDSGADYFTVVTFGGLAEAVAENKKKGQSVAIEGRIDYSSYEDSEGKKRSFTRIVAHDVQFLDSVGGGINQVVLLGNLTRDPETRYVTVANEEGVPVTTFGLAMNRVRSREDRADFIEVDCWRELGEIVADHKKKGHGVLVTGRLAQDRWQNAEGEARQKVKVVADGVQYTTTAQGRAQANGRAHRSGGNGQSNGQAKSQGKSQGKKQYKSRLNK